MPPKVMPDDVIALEPGWVQVFNEGIVPFIAGVENDGEGSLNAKNFVPIYDIIFKMASQHEPWNWSEQLYLRFSTSIRDHLASRVVPAMETAKGGGYDVVFLREWRARWNKHKALVKGLAKLFMYLDKYYTPSADTILSLKEQGFKLYLDAIFTPYAPTARLAILNCIERERNAEAQDRQLLQESVNVFIEMGYNYNTNSKVQKLAVYQSELERFVIEHASAYYKRETVSWKDEDSCPNYLEKAEKMLATEQNRVESYLNRASLEPLHKECHLQLLRVHLFDVLRKNTGLGSLLTSNSLPDLTRLYRLYKKFPEDLLPIAEMFFEVVSKEGGAIIDSTFGVKKKKVEPNEPNGGEEKEKADGADDEDAESVEAENKSRLRNGGDTNHALVCNLIALHAKYNGIVDNCFEKNQIFDKSLKKAFDEFINRDERVSKLLAQFVNEALKKGNKLGLTDVESVLENVVFLYGYIRQKDVFERDYQTFLAQRLLEGLCESEHSEKSMIAKLKNQCGYSWTSKLEGMFKDVQVSKEMGSQYKKLSASTALPDASGLQVRADEMLLDVNVCTTGCWPQSKVIPFHFPKDIEAACDKFKRFYLGSHSGHKLEWRMDQGLAEVQVDFSPKVKRSLVLTTYQMMIMLVFSEKKTPITFKEILDVTGLPRHEVSHHLLSLVHPKVGVLLKRPEGKELAPGHKFIINQKYANQLKKIIIPLMRPIERESADDLAASVAIELQRRCMIDAAAVRIMKSRKKMRHNQLTADVIAQLSMRFKPTPTDIKKRIESLIIDGFLERDADDRASYSYLA